MRQRDARSGVAAPGDEPDALEADDPERGQRGLRCPGADPPSTRTCRGDQGRSSRLMRAPSRSRSGGPGSHPRRSRSPRLIGRQPRSPPGPVRAWDARARGGIAGRLAVDAAGGSRARARAADRAPGHVERAQRSPLQPSRCRGLRCRAGASDLPAHAGPRSPAPRTSGRARRSASSSPSRLPRALAAAAVRQTR